MMSSTQHYISIKTLCKTYDVSDVFIRQLEEFELIDVYYDQDPIGQILEDHLKELESMIRLYRDLNINIEGLHAVRHLQSRIRALENELLELRMKNRLVR